MFKPEVNQPSVQLSPHLFCELICTEFEEGKEWSEKDLGFSLGTPLNLLKTRKTWLKIGAGCGWMSPIPEAFLM